MKVKTYLFLVRKTILIIILTSLTQSIVFSQCLPDGIIFTTQAQIDSFQTDYPGCTEIVGDVEINGYEIDNLNGLSEITAINGNLSILLNGSMSDLSGLNNLRSIGKYLDISANRIYSLNGLDSLITIGSGFAIYNNSRLENLENMRNLTSCGGSITIKYNDEITSLSGIENINAGSITDLHITDNYSLTECEVENICNYLANPNGEYEIKDNGNGCSNLQQVIDACNTPIDECYRYGVDFYSQIELDNFQIEYPQCRKIMGDVFINGSDISSLSGLSSINTIDGSLIIRYANELTNLSGLDSLRTINGEFYIFNNNSLQDLTGLEMIDSLPDNLSIKDNQILSDLSGLNNLKKIGTNLIVKNNDSLRSIQALSALNSVFAVKISDNYLLENLEGLENIDSIEGFIIANNNSKLESLNGIQNLESIGGISVYQNYSLRSLANFNNIDSLAIDLFIVDNYNLLKLDGLHRIKKVKGKLTIENNFNLESLQGLDSLEIIGSHMEIRGIPNITNFSHLENLKEIGGSIYITGNNNLSDLNGMQNITTCESMYISGNHNLKRLTGINNITKINGDLTISNNSKLNDISAFLHVKSLNGDLTIRYNDSLIRLFGLDSISHSSINKITVTNNKALSSCSVKSICDYLAMPNGQFIIHDNYDGCNSPEQIDFACQSIGVEEMYFNAHQLTIYPNPSKSKILISNIEGATINELTIYNQLGQKVLQTENPGRSVNISKLESGLFVMEIEIDGMRFREIFIKK